MTQKILKCTQLFECYSQGIWHCTYVVYLKILVFIKIFNRYILNVIVEKNIWTSIECLVLSWPDKLLISDQAFYLHVFCGDCLTEEKENSNLDLSIFMHFIGFFFLKVEENMEQK